MVLCDQHLSLTPAMLSVCGHGSDEMTTDATAENEVESLLTGGFLWMRALSGQGTLGASLAAPERKIWQERVGRAGGRQGLPCGHG